MGRIHREINPGRIEIPRKDTNMTKNSDLEGVHSSISSSHKEVLYVTIHFLVIIPIPFPNMLQLLVITWVWGTNDSQIPSFGQ